MGTDRGTGLDAPRFSAIDPLPELLQQPLSGAALLVFSHRSNLQRLHAGTESRFEKARLLGRLLGLRGG